MFLALEKDNERFPEQSRRSFETLQTVLPRQKFPVDGEGCVRAPSPDYSCKSYDRLLELHTSATVVGFVSMWAGGGGGSACCNMDSESSITLRASSLHVDDGSTPALLLQDLGFPSLGSASFHLILFSHRPSNDDLHEATNNTIDRSHSIADLVFINHSIEPIRSVIFISGSNVPSLFQCFFSGH